MKRLPSNRDKNQDLMGDECAEGDIEIMVSTRSVLFPSTWKTAELGSCFELQNGINFSSEQKGNGLLVVDVLNMFSDDLYVRTDRLYRVDIKVPEERLLRSGDILFVRSSVKEQGVGWPAIFRGHEEPVTNCGFLIRARQTSQKLEPKFVVHYLRQAHVRSQMISRAGKVAITNINQERLGSLKIPLPPIAEQKRIAAILDKAEELRGLRRKALDELDAIVQSIFLEMFGDPVLNPKNWEIGRLENIADFQTGYPFSSNEYMSEGEVIKLCRGANVLPNRIDWSDLACWSKSRINGLLEFSLQSGDVVIAMDRPWISGGFKIAQIQNTDLPALLVQRVARLRGNDSVSNAFIFQLLKHPVFTRHCKPTETTIPHISPKDIKTFKFPLPPLALQQEFAQQVKAIERLKATHRELLAQLNALFASLQHRAFRGEL